MRRWLFRTATLASIVFGWAHPGWSQHKKVIEPKSQVQPLAPELPRVLGAPTQQLVFRLTPLLTSGHLSSQTRESVSNVIKESRGATIVKIRAFVAGAGDARRVQDVVRDQFLEHKLPLPIVSIVQVGALGSEKAAIVLEAVVASRRPENPNGLAFFPGEIGHSVESAAEKLEEAARAAQIPASEIVSATCFTAQLEDYKGSLAKFQSLLPHAAVNLVQAQRDPVDSNTTCEAIARLPEAGGGEAGGKSVRVTRATGPQLLFTGMLFSFGTYLDDADAALSRLQQQAGSAHADVGSAVSVNVFSLHPAAASALSKTMGRFHVPPATVTIQPVEGLPSIDAALGVETVLMPGLNTALVSSVGGP